MVVYWYYTILYISGPNSDFLPGSVLVTLSCRNNKAHLLLFFFLSLLLDTFVKILVTTIWERSKTWRNFFYTYTIISIHTYSLDTNMITMLHLPHSFHTHRQKNKHTQTRTHTDTHTQKLMQNTFCTIDK